MPRPRLALPASRITRSIPVLLASSLVALLSAAPAGAFQGPWALPAVTLSAALQGVLEPQVAIAPDGTATVVWSRSNGTNTIVQAATRPPGGSFTSPVDLSTLGQDASFPQVAVAPDGTTTVVWTRSNGTNSIAQAATRPPGGSFGAPIDLSAPGQNAAFSQIESAPDGTTTAVWRQSNGTNTIVQAATRSPGGSFSGPVDLSVAGQDASEQQIAIAANGTTTVVWTRSDGANVIAQVSTRSPGGSFSSPADLSVTGQDANDPQVAAAADGTTTAVWRRSDGANTIIQASTRPPGGSFGSAIDVSVAGQDAAGPQLAGAPDGSTTVVWARSNGTFFVIQASTRPADGGFGSPVDLSAGDQNAFTPQIAIAPDGTSTAVWLRSPGLSEVVQTATRPPGGGFGSPLDLSASGQDANEPQLAVAPDGSVTAIWPRSDGTSYRAEATSTANPPALRAAPSILGTPTLGSTLSCDGGLWTGAASVSTNWLRDGAVIASGPAYAVATADQGRVLLCRGRATNPFGGAEAQSLPILVATTPAPAPDRDAPALTVLTKTRLTRTSFLRNGVTVRVSANEPATVLAELLARAKGARISAVPFNLTLGSRTARRVQNSVAIKIRPNRTLVGKARSFSIRLRLTAEDAAGNRRVTGKTIKVAG